MIEIKKKKDCCGCTACVSVCPKKSISMAADREGFLYPVTDMKTCIGCNACNNICPIINNKEPRIPLQCYAAINKNCDILSQSSSGGVFSAIAEYVLQKKNGVVFGAMWQCESVVHGYVESVNDLYKLRGSKYVQSDLKDSLIKVRDFLKDGRYVLFSGTPCQIGGLKAFLKKEYDNLLTIDVACHGAPSPLVLRRYVKCLKQQYNVDSIDINFRDKVTGWNEYSVSAKHKDKVLFSEQAVKNNIYMRGFLHELYSRPSCHDCKFKSFSSQSDITLADFWGVENVLPDCEYSKGVSLMIINTHKANCLVPFISTHASMIQVCINQALNMNASLISSTKPHPDRNYFFRKIKSENVTQLIEKCVNLRIPIRIRLLTIAFIYKFLNK